MNSSQPEYEKYKDSGVEWLGEIPEHWELTRLGTRFTERRTKVSDKDYEPLSVTKQGILPQLESAAKSNDGDNRKLVKAGNFVINSRSDRKGSSGIAKIDGSVSLINIVIEPQNVNPSYCNYLLKSYVFVEEFYRMGHGIVADLWTTRYDEMRGIKIAIPPLKEQTAIASFIDQKTVKIDQAIAQKVKLIELLKERRQILIHHAVTKGLNNDENSLNCDFDDDLNTVISKPSQLNQSPSQNQKKSKFRPSGVEWIGEIPEHWEVKRLKYLLKEFNIRSTTGNEELLSLSKYSGIIPKSSLEERAGGAESLIGYKKVKPEQLVINKMQAVNGLIAISKITGITSPDYSVYEVLDNTILDINFLGLLILQPEYLSEFKRRVTGVMEGFIRLYTNDLYEVFVNVPPIEEQQKIIHKINFFNEKIATAISLKEKEIEKLKEYKATLINSAVTGKIKVSHDA